MKNPIPVSLHTTILKKAAVLVSISVLFLSPFANIAYATVTYCNQTGVPTNVPTEFCATYASLNTSVQAFEPTVDSTWNGSKPAVGFGAWVYPASDLESPVQNPNFYTTGVLPYIKALHSMGAKTAIFLINSPLLTQSFYTWCSQPSVNTCSASDYNTRINFFKQVVAGIHSYGMKVMIQTQVQPGQGGSYTSDPLDVDDYYASLSWADYINTRAQTALTIEQQLQPDYLNFESEPDTEAQKSNRSEIAPSNANFVTNVMQLTNGILSTLEGANITGLNTTYQLVVGMGSWEQKMSTLLPQMVALPDISVIDIHVHPINDTNAQDLPNIYTIANAAIAAGKRVAMGDAMIYKESTSEIGSLAANIAESRYYWTFWQPMDLQFSQQMTKIAYTENMVYMSISFSDDFFANLDYANTPGCVTPPSTVCSPTQWDSAGSSAAFTNLSTNPPTLTPLGTMYEQEMAGNLTTPDTQAPTIPTNLVGTATSSSQINLSWTASTDNVGVTGYKIFRNGTQVGTATSNSYSDTNLSAKTPYVYTVAAYDAAGNTSVPSIPVSVTTLSLGNNIPPTVPTGFVLQSEDQSDAIIAWTPSTDPVAVTGYNVYRNGAQVGTVTVPLFSDSGLTPSTTYTYTVSAFDAAGNTSTQSTPFSVTTLASLPVGGGGGGGAPIPIIPIPVPTPVTMSPPSYTLINTNGTYYLIENGILSGITDPGILNSYGFTFADAVPATAADLALPQGPLLSPNDGALVKTASDPTVYLISNRERLGFTSEDVFNSLGFQFSSVLTVTSPELNALTVGNVLNNGTAAHPEGVQINDNGTIYLMGTTIRDPYPSLEVYNSWNIDNDFSNVVPANAADEAIPVGLAVQMRVVAN